MADIGKVKWILVVIFVTVIGLIINYYPFYVFQKEMDVINSKLDFINSENSENRLNIDKLERLYIESIRIPEERWEE